MLCKLYHLGALSGAFLVVDLLFSLLMAMQISKPNAPLDSSIDQSPYINVTEDGLVAGLNNEPTTEIQKKNK